MDADDETLTFAVPQGTRRALRLFFVAMAALVPVGVISSSRVDALATAITLVWVVVVIGYLLYWLRKIPERLALTSGGVLHVEGPIRRLLCRDIAVIDIYEIRPRRGFVRMTDRDGSVWVPVQLDGLTDLVDELMSQNPSIRYEGPWPPSAGW